MQLQVSGPQLLFNIKAAGTGMQCTQESCMQAQCPALTAAEQAEATTATLFLDTQLLRMLDSVEPEVRQEFNQVVLVGDGMDTRPFRWVSSQQGPSVMLAPGIGLRGNAMDSGSDIGC